MSPTTSTQKEGKYGRTQNDNKFLLNTDHIELHFIRKI